MTEAVVILWTGVAVGVVGLAATASNGVALMLRRIRVLAEAAQRWIEHRLARIFPSRRRDATARPPTAISSAISSASGVFTTMTRRQADATVEVQLDVLWKNFESLQSRLQHLEEQTQSHHSALSASLDALTTEVRESLSKLTARLDEEASDAARTDARGLGPVAFGFVMVAVPDHLASVSLFGAFFTVAALIVTAATVKAVFPGMLRTSTP